MIAAREAVRAAIQRALDLDPCEDRAVQAVAQAMGLPPEAVREVLTEHEVTT